MSCLGGCSVTHRANWWLLVRPCFPPQDDFDVTPTAILSYVERKFIKLLVAAVKKEIKLIKDRRCFSFILEEEKRGRKLCVVMHVIILTGYPSCMHAGNYIKKNLTAIAS